MQTVDLAYPKKGKEGSHLPSPFGYFIGPSLQIERNLPFSLSKSGILLQGRKKLLQPRMTHPFCMRWMPILFHFPKSSFQFNFETVIVVVRFHCWKIDFVVDVVVEASRSFKNSRSGHESRDLVPCDSPLKVPTHTNHTTRRLIERRKSFYTSM
jgi:hypothetical protein